MRPTFYSPPARPHDERARQAAVDASGVLARGDDPALQAIVARAAALFDVPIAALSIIDRHRQWFAGQIGLAVSETSRAASFCGHAILDGAQPMVVADATLDRRFAGNPLVAGPLGLRFYAGAPLVDADGHRLGALCVIDTTPRGMPPPDMLSRLVALSREAGDAIAGQPRGADRRTA